MQDKITWSLENRKLSDLKDNPKNPRQLSSHDAEHLQISLEKFGLIDKLIINSDGTIIGGHQRKKILKKMGLKSIEVWVPSRELNQKEVDELNIRLNRNTGEWDFDILANQWELPALIEYGFTIEEILDATPEEIVDAAEEDDSELLMPGKDEDAVTLLGDIYELNQHRLVCGDSTLPDYVTKVLNGAEPILMVTDPPYGVEYDPSWRKKVNLKGSKISAGIVKNDDKSNWALTYALFPGSVSYIWTSSKFATEVAKNIQDAEFEIISQIIWVKQHFALSRGDYHYQHEPCWYAVKKSHTHNWQGSRKESTIWEISNQNAFSGKAEEGEDERTAHSTQKPIECMARPIRNNTAKGEGVYDPFLGSGTTLIASEQLGRICYGIELSPAYCDIIVNRWKNFMVKNNREYSIKRNGQQINELENV